MSTDIITDQKELLQLERHLQEKKEIGIDLEFDKNYYRYGFNLCLMQISDENSCYLIDPLSKNISIDGIFPVLENPDIELITFAFGEDIRLLHKIGCRPTNIHDLSITATLLNHEPGSLSTLIESVLDVETGHSSQTSNWFKRPLSERQISYASEDVKYLHELKDKLVNRAREAGIQSWIEQEKKQWEQEDHSETNGSSIIKEKDKKGLSEYDWMIYTVLMNYWDRKAKQMNRPFFKVIPKKLVKEVAADPDKIDRWEKLNGVPGRFRNGNIKSELSRAVGKAVAKAEKRGLSKDKPARAPLSGEERKLHQHYRTKVSEAKSQLFNPVKEKIAEDFGEEVATFLFSNRIITNIVKNGIEEVEPYKKELITDYASRLDIDPSTFIDDF